MLRNRMITVAVLTALAIAAGPLAYGDNGDGWGAAARYTAQASVLMFVLTFAGPALARLVPGLGFAAASRDWGLCFGVAFYGHLIALVINVSRFGTWPALPDLIPGVLVYAILTILFVSSLKGIGPQAGPGWRRLHRFGLWYIWLIFIFAYVAGVTSPEVRWIDYAALALVIAAALLRLRGEFERRRAVSVV